MLAAQVVYTNVEEDRSPHKRRGFQLWLWTKSLPKPVLDEVEQRVNTFARVTPDEGKALRAGPPRRLFAPLVSADSVMLAEAVPLEKPDRIGRGGRFHTHALLLDKAEFEKAGGNPFAVFDGRFPFQRDPDLVPDEVWKANDLPRVEITPAEAAGAGLPDKLRPLVPELVGWLLGGPQGKHVVLPVGVPDAEAVLREVFRLLPPAARVQAGFDTFWIGRGKYPPAVSGPGNPTLLQTWVFRQFVRLEPGRTRTPLPASDWHKRLAEWWATAPDLTREDRECGRTLAGWVAGGDTLPDKPTAAAVEWAKGLPGVEGRWAKAVAAAARAGCPDLVLRLPGVRAKSEGYFGGWGVEGVERVRVGIDTNERVKWVSEAVFADPPHPLDADTADVLFNWRAASKHLASLKLKQAACRWLPEQTAYVRNAIQNAAVDDWFVDYCRRTLPADLKGPGAAKRLADDAIRHGGTLPADAELYEMLNAGSTADGEELDQLRLLLKFQNRLDGDAAGFLRQKPGLSKWAQDFVLPRVAGEVRYVALVEPNTTDLAGKDREWGRFFNGCGKSDHPLALIGLRLPPAADTGGALLAHFADQMRSAFLPAIDGRFQPRYYFPLISKPTGVDKKAGWHECKKAREKKPRDEKERGEKEKGLADAVAAADDLVFRQLAEDHLLKHLHGWATQGDPWDDGGRFVGVAVIHRADDKEKDAVVTLFRALVGSAVPLVRAGTEAAALPPAVPAHIDRFGWLAVRLLHPSTTDQCLPSPAAKPA